MAFSTRPDLFDALSIRISEGVDAVNPTLMPIEVDVFFADEILFASATQRADEGTILWRSSHAATPDSASLEHLERAGDDIIDRIVSDARLTDAVAGTTE